MNPVIQIRNLAVSFGDSISFLSMGQDTLMQERCRALLGWAGGTSFDFAQDRLCPYVGRGKKKAAMFIAAFSLGLRHAGEGARATQSSLVSGGLRRVRRRRNRHGRRVRGHLGRVLGHHRRRRGDVRDRTSVATTIGATISAAFWTAVNWGASGYRGVAVEVGFVVGEIGAAFDG